MKRLLVTGFLFLAMALVSFVPQAKAIGTPAGTSITNQAFADYKDANGNPLARVYSNIVSTVVSQVYAVRTEPPTATQTGAVNTDVYYPATIHNDGNGADTFDLTALNDTVGWTTDIYLDADKNGALDPTELSAGPITKTSLLPANGIEYVIVVTHVPSDGIPDTTSTVTLTATSQNNPGATASSLFTTTVLQAVLNISKTASPDFPIPGAEITYTITIKNNGNNPAYYASFIDQIPAFTTYVAGSMRVGPLGGTYTTATVLTDANDPDGAYYNSSTIPKQLEFIAGTIAAGQSFIGYFKVKVDANVPAGTSIQNRATASFKAVDNPAGTTYTSTSNQAASTVDQDPSVSVTPNMTTAAGDPGDLITYPLLVCNDGNDTDTLDITYTSSAGWTWIFWYDANRDGIAGGYGDYKLIDTDADGKIDTNDLAQGECAPILAVTTIPAGTPDGSTDTLVVTATSTNDPTVSDTSGNLVTTVTAPVLTITKAVFPAGPQPPGTTLTYTVTVSNIGTGTATSVIISDVRPNFTTYVTGSIRTGVPAALVSRTDAVDGDGAQFDSASKTVVASNPSLGSGGSYVLEFKVTIN